MKLEIQNAFSGKNVKKKKNYFHLKYFSLSLSGSDKF